MIRGPHLANRIVTENGSITIKNEDGWFLTNDIGQIKGDYVYFLGRSDDIINLSGFKISAEFLEGKLASRLKCGSSIAVCGVPDQLRGEMIAIAVTPNV